MNKKYFPFSYVMNKKKRYSQVSIFDASKTAFMTKGDLSGHVKSYQDTIRDKKILCFFLWWEQEKATLLICSEGWVPIQILWLPIQFVKIEIFWPKYSVSKSSSKKKSSGFLSYKRMDPKALWAPDSPRVWIWYYVWHGIIVLGYIPLIFG